MAPKHVQHREDRRVQRDEEARRVRTRLDGHGEHFEGLDVTARQHNLRLRLRKRISASTYIDPIR